MKVLSRYLLLQNLYLMGVCLCLGITIYLLSDLFERLDDFLSAGLGFKIMLLYFGVKVPLIISQILPAVFLVAMLIQLSTMHANRELLALRAGGVSFRTIIAFFLMYSLFWSGAQLFFSQYVGVKGMEYSQTIWAQDVRGRDTTQRELFHLWFRDEGTIIYIDAVQPALGRGRGLSIYKLSQDKRSVDQFITASAFRVLGAEWELTEAQIIEPASFSTVYRPTMRMHVGEAMRSFTSAESKKNPAQLPLWELRQAIRQLEVTGSNVEGLQTIWHGKISYAMSITVMAFLALAIITFQRNIYLNLTAGLLATFVFYGLFVLGSSAGEMGLLPPFAGAWMGNTIFILAASARLFWRSIAHSGR